MSSSDSVDVPPSRRLEMGVFGLLPDGTVAHRYILRNSTGVEAHVTNYGGILLALKAPDDEGRFDDIVLGLPSLADYQTNRPYFGALIGRYANRIADGRFVLDGKTYRLTQNDGSNHLHGGRRGFDAVLWQATPFTNQASSGVVLTHTSPDGDEGYPGTLHIEVKLTLDDQNRLTLDYTASTDKPTPLNLTYHPYFNLAGHASGSVKDHHVQILAEHFTPIREDLIPTGRVQPVQDTPFDLRQPAPIRAYLRDAHPQIQRAGGYDHTFVLAQNAGQLQRAARVSEPSSGRVLTVDTTEPGLQFYTGNALDGRVIGKEGMAYERHAGFCLEAQHFPDSPNQPAFPSTIRHPGQPFHSRTVYTFSAKRA